MQTATSAAPPCAGQAVPVGLTRSDHYASGGQQGFLQNETNAMVGSVPCGGLFHDKSGVQQAGKLK
jgi:hypothetical protein